MYEYGKNLKLIGNSVDEEEAYLKMVSNIGAYKRYYINFNGAPMSEVVFWDILVFLEATKTYVKLMKGKEVDPIKLKKILSINKNQSNNPHIRAKDTEKYNRNKKPEKEVENIGIGGMQIFGGGGGDEKTHTFNKNLITNYIKKNVAFNEQIAKIIPKFILYPIVRYALYAEYLAQNSSSKMPTTFIL